jgi:hypothetical protein
LELEAPIGTISALVLGQRREAQSMLFGLSPVELLVIGGLAVLLFGSRLPPLGRSLWRTMDEFRRGVPVNEEFDRPAREASRPILRDLVIAVVLVEAMLLAFVFYVRFVGS